MLSIDAFIASFSAVFQSEKGLLPWHITQNLSAILQNIQSRLTADFTIKGGIAIHKTATVEDRAILKPPIIIEENCFVGANAYFRNGVYIGKNSSVGPGCEIKTSIIFNQTEIAHLNFIGDSILGSNINFEAGAIAANYFNERTDKLISVMNKGIRINSGATKFGSLVGDNCKIGANAVLSPGTILGQRTIVKRLELVEQIK